MPAEELSRDDLASKYFEQLPYEPYPIQEEALLAWFTAEKGLLVCAPTGTGKTLIAEAALFEALHRGQRAYYTTPLIALTDQKFHEMQESAQRWGFSADSVGLITGNRRVNPEATVLVVVAEILFNRLLHREAFDFADTAVVVMDEFHSFNDPQRGIVWEFSLGMLPEHVRLLLLSATVGNSVEFVSWLAHRHNRRLLLAQSEDRKIPLTYQWVGDTLLSEQIEAMAAGDDDARKTPALVFCFNRDMCWSVAEQLKGKKLLAAGQQAQLVEELEQYDLSQGAGPKLRQVLLRGVGVHHAGVLPKYRRIVEDLFQRKLLSVCICTETLAAGVNLPARSVLLPNLLKGPPDKKRLIEASAAHQMFGRAGRPQFDTQGFVFGLAHEDDVKIARWRVKYDQIPEDTKDPALRKAKKKLKKKMPTRRSTQQYWNETHFNKLRDAKPGNLASRGALPWRMLAYMLDLSPEVEPIRQLVGKRLLDSRQLEIEQKTLQRMLMTLRAAGYVKLEPEPPKEDEPAPQDSPNSNISAEVLASIPGAVMPSAEPPPPYRPQFAHATPDLQKLLKLRGIHPLYGLFLVNQLGIADQNERIQALESVLELPGSVAYHVHVPPHEELPPGPLATTRLDPQLLRLGLVTLEQLGAAEKPEEEEEPAPRGMFEEEKVWTLTLADKLRMLFDHDFPGLGDLRTRGVWAAGDILAMGGDFNKYVTSHRLQKQEGVLFRHMLRLILLVAEFAQFCPPETSAQEWREDLDEISRKLSECCHRVDPSSTDKTLAEAQSDQEGPLL